MTSEPTSSASGASPRPRAFSRWDKFSRYLGLLPGLALAYGLYFAGQGHLWGTAGAVARYYQPWAVNTKPTRLVLGSDAYSEVIHYRRMVIACDIGPNAPVAWERPPLECDWKAVLKSALSQKASIQERPPAFDERISLLLESMENAHVEYADKGGLAASPEFGALIAERDALLSVVEENVKAAEGALQTSLVLHHLAAVAAVLALLFFRNGLGRAMLWPVSSMFRLLGFIHRKV